MSVISNSEISHYKACQRQHYYGFGRNLQSRRQSTSLSRGIVGHEVLAIYYEEIKEGATSEDAADKAIDYLRYLMIEDLESGAFNNEWLVPLQTRLEEYFNWAPSVDNFRVLEVETEYRTALPGTIQEYAMQLDLLVEMTSGPYVGKTALIDHKIVYNFYTENELAMNAQLPKYIGILQTNGLNVSISFLNQIRHRVNKTEMSVKDKFRRDIIIPTKTEIKTIFREELKVAEEIALLRTLPLEIWSQEVVRTMNSQVCKLCPFPIMCKAELQGQDVALMRAVEFVPRTYGYSTTKEDENV